MNAMKISLCATLGILLLGLTNCSDRKPHRPDGQGSGGLSMGSPQQNAQRMAADLGLSEGQKRKFMSAMKEHGEKMRAIRSNSAMSQDERNRKTMAARQQLAQKMHGILTAEQFEKWKQEREAMRPQGGAGGSGMGPGAGGVSTPGAPPPVGPMGGYPTNGTPPPGT